MDIEDEIRDLENDIAIIESFQAGVEWNPYIQEKAAEIMAQADDKIDSLMLNNLDKDQVLKMVNLLARFTKCQEIDNPRRVLPNSEHQCCESD